MNLNKWKPSASQQFLLLTLLTGLSAGLVAIILQKSVYLFEHVLNPVSGSFTLYTFLIGGVSILLASILTTRLMKVCSGSGIPRIKILLTVQHGVIHTKEWITKLVATILTLASGVPMGLEAPTVFIAGGVGSSLARSFKLPERKIKDLIYVGCSAGIAAAFNTPIAAVIFTMEEIIGHTSSKAMGPILISALIASVTASSLNGQNSIFHPLHYSFNDPKELIFYLMLGLIAGVCGPLFIKNTIIIKKIVNKFFKHHRMTPIFIVFLLVGALSFLDPRVPTSGLNFVNQLFTGEVPGARELLILLILKFIAIAFCSGAGMSAGIMLPIMVLGAIIGGIVGQVSHDLFETNSIQIGAYCLVGMGAFFAAVIRTPFTSIILVFEMTRDYRIILPLMLANLVAYFLAERIRPGSIYEQIASFEGYELPNHEEEDLLGTLTVEESYQVLHQVIELQPHKYIVYPDQSLSRALIKLKQIKQHDHLIVVDRLNPTQQLGFITLQNILDRIKEHHHS